MKNALLALVAIIVVLGGAYFLMSNRADAPITENREQVTENGNPAGETSMLADDERPEPVVITYSGTGYSPSSVTVKKGQAVRFVNNADAQTWPASAIHPTHGVYPEKTDADCLGSAFDACKGLGKGESWEFTFNQVGTWRFHDHLHAQHTGSVIVEE